MMKVQNVPGAVGQVVQVGIDESMVKVRYTDGSESWESIDSLVLADAVVTAGNWKEKNNYPKADRVVGYRY